VSVGPVARRLGARTTSALLPVVLAFGVVVGLLLVAGAPPFQALRYVWSGAMGGSASIGDTLMAWVPLTLAGAGSQTGRQAWFHRVVPLSITVISIASARGDGTYSTVSKG